MNFIEEVERLYKVKLSKYENVDDRLSIILQKEAITEVLAMISLGGIV